MTIKEIENKVCRTTDVQEACMIGFSEGYDSGYNDGFQNGFKKGLAVNDTEDEANIIDWDDVKKGTTIHVNYSNDEHYPESFDVPFVAFYNGFVVLDVEYMNADNIIYDGFPPRICSVKE